MPSERARYGDAGKTTLLSQIVGLVRPTSGRISLLGRDPVAEPAWARTACSFQPQAQAPLTGVTTRQAIEIVGRIAAFCMAIVEPGSLVMLDEPTNDVDPVRRRLPWEQVRALAADGHGVVLVTHNIAEAERAIDRVVVLDHGRVAAAGTPAER